MYSFPNLKLISCSMSSFNCYFLICIHISQETGYVIWYSFLFKNFPPFPLIHTVKCLSIVKGAETDVFLEFLSIHYDPVNVGNLIAGSSAFSKPSLYIWTFSVHVHWSLAWKILSTTMLAYEMSAIVLYVEKCSFALPFFGTGIKPDIFHFCVHCWVFQIWWYFECNTLTASSFRILNSSVGIPSPPLVLFIVLLPKSHMTWHSRMPVSR